MNNTLMHSNPSPAGTEKPEMNTERPVLVWDFPTRIFHWALALCFAGAMITQEMESLRVVHNTCGYTILGLIGFRIIWGVVGTRHARFLSFVPTPARVFAYVRGLIAREPIHTVGHNPLGALGILLILLLAIGVVTSGILVDSGFAEDIFEEVHESLANLMLFVIGVHVVGVLFSSVIHHENLTRSMISGYKLANPAQGIRHSFWWLGLALVLGIGYFWVLQLHLITA